ncbi:uncharacterized protein Dana_GF12073, isoform F [Drosophila ananassae]|uniref:Uncharacterized protein, isoform F n=1 Tax=Drosophila ananassae TaxID=7217 RepID=A0A0P9ADF6_DROAN|nr:ERC protein 2 isoform X2 [Drosophila ananassae]KPU76080.1 uncharacterized protein Dana_GF12073, isoform F [Drosophila ananassae]
MSSLPNGSANVRDNRASRLRAEKLAEKPQKQTIAWTNAPTRPGGFGKPEPCYPQGLPALHPRSHSRIPTRRVPGVKTSRATSPARSIRGTSTDRVSICSLPSHLEEKARPKRKALVGEDGDKPNNKDKEASSVDVNINDKKDCKTVNKRMRLDLSETPRPAAKNVIPPRSISANPLKIRKKKTDVKPDRGHHRILEMNKIRVVDVQQKKLENMQSEFMAKIRSLGSLAKELKGVYKFVAMVVNDECKLIMHEDDMLRLPRNIPTESVNDLKNRCRYIVDTGFMMFYDFMPLIQHAKSDQEAQEKREQLRAQLKNAVNRKINGIIEEIDELCRTKGVRDESSNSLLYREINDLRVQKTNMETRYFDLKKEHIELMNQQKDELEAKMAAELAVRDHCVLELKKSLRRSEELVGELNIELAEKNDDLKSESNTISKLRSELDDLNTVNNRIRKRLEDADLGLERAHKSVTKNEEKISYLEDELKEAREFIVNLQKRPDPLDDKSMGEKDLIIADLKLKLQNFEHHRNMMQKQVSSAVKQLAEFEELNCKYQTVAVQVNELREQLRNSDAKLMTQARIEEQLRKDLEKLREQAGRDQKMLSMRSELINNLQENEKESQNKINKMYYQANEKDTLLKQVSNELASKDEEFRNLFGTLTFKQKEVRRQEHIIKLLEEQNSRNTMLRAKQDERNAAMQAEIVNLKRTIHKYSKIIIGNNGQRFFEVVPADECSDYCCVGDAVTEIKDSEEAPMQGDSTVQQRMRPQQQQQQQSQQRRHRSMSQSHGRRIFDPLHHLQEQQHEHRHRRSPGSPHHQEARHHRPQHVPTSQQQHNHHDPHQHQLRHRHHHHHH